MYDVFYNNLQPSLKDLQLHFMDTDSFVLSFSEANVPDEHMDLSNLEAPIKTNKKFPSNFKHELGSRMINEFMALSPKTYSFKDYSKNNKERGIKNCNNAKHEVYYNALMYNTQRTVDKCRLQKVGDNMTTKKQVRLVYTFDDKRFDVNHIKSYPHDENIYLFKRDRVNKIYRAPLDLAKNQLVKNILELTIK